MEHKIQPLIPGNLEGLEEIARQLLEGIPPENTGDDEESHGEVGLKSNTDFWTISGVNYRNRVHKVDLSKSLLDNGNSKTQDKWVEYSKSAKQRNDFYTGDFPLYHALFRALFFGKDSSDKDKVEEARAFLEKQFKEKWLMTLSRVRYMPSGKDIVIHNFGMPDKIEIPEDFVGKNEWVKDSKTPQVYNTLLGSNNVQEINQIYSWITKKPAYLYRINSKQQGIDERVARFDAYSGGAVLYCYWDPSYTSSSLGVRVN